MVLDAVAPRGLFSAFSGPASRWAFRWRRDGPRSAGRTESGPIPILSPIPHPFPTNPQRRTP